ncbi:MAG TPA: hypothetical protein VI932_04020 [Bacteroidota bacterium]|nr:hypothetical protein [Bacteroidota bacterium]
MIALFDKLRKPVIYGLLPVLICLVTDSRAIAGGLPPDDEEVQGTNIRWTVKDDVIIINYDLLESVDIKYRVDVIMKREGDEAFAAIPLTVEGDIGEGFYAGKNREIRWYYRRDYPSGFQGAGYFFEFRVEKIGEDNTVLYYALGAAAIAGGVLAFIVGRSQEEPAVVGIPGPPVRP